MLITRHTPIALALLSLYSANVFANTSETTSNTDERINVLVVKGYTAPSATTQSYTSDTVINIVPTNSDINKTLDQVIAENTPGFVHANSGGPKHASANYHRGLSDEYTLYLLNGVAFPTSTLGSQSVPDIPMESIALIEVIRGAQASLYGSSSLTGVINIVTKTGDKKDAQVNISAGSHDSGRMGGVYANNINNVYFMTSLKVDKSDGYDIKDDGVDEEYGFETYSMNSYVAHVTENRRLSLAVNNGTDELEYDSGGVAEQTTDTLQITAKYIQRINTNTTTELTLSAADIDADYDSPAYGTSHYATSETLAQLHINNEWEKLAFNFGGEFIDSEFTENSTQKNREQSALYAAISGNFNEGVNLSTGLRYDHYSDFGDAFTYSVGLGLFNIAELSYRTSFSAPSYSDLYSSWGGNPDLESEEGEIVELALTHNIDTEHAYIPLKLSLYTGSIKNKIEWVSYTPYNVGEVSIHGVEAYMQYNMDRFTYDITGAYSQSIDESTNEQLDNVPKWSASSSIQYNMTDTITPKLIYSYLGGRTNSYNGDLDATHRLNFSMNYQITPHFNASFNIDNITDSDDQLYSGYNADGRTFLVSISAQL